MPSLSSPVVQPAMSPIVRNVVDLRSHRSSCPSHVYLSWNRLDIYVRLATLSLLVGGSTASSPYLMGPNIAGFRCFGYPEYPRNGIYLLVHGAHLLTYILNLSPK